LIFAAGFENKVQLAPVSCFLPENSRRFIYCKNIKERAMHKNKNYVKLAVQLWRAGIGLFFWLFWGSMLVSYLFIYKILERSWLFGTLAMILAKGIPKLICKFKLVLNTL
jgi:hypothetical protein